MIFSIGRRIHVTVRNSKRVELRGAWVVDDLVLTLFGRDWRLRRKWVEQVTTQRTPEWDYPPSAL